MRTVRAHNDRRGRPIQRFCCLTCGTTYSARAFSTIYYLKRPELLLPVAALLHAGAGHRQIARSLGCAPSTVTRLSARLGRQALLFHAHVMAELAEKLDEPKDSWFIYALDPAPHRRTGRRSAVQQKRVISRPTRPRHGGYKGSTRRILESLLGLTDKHGSLELVGDGHPSYESAVSRHPDRDRIRLRRFPNPRRGPRGSPRSETAIARDQAMFPVDLLHSLLRHSLAAHRRETIAFGAA